MIEIINIFIINMKDGNKEIKEEKESTLIVIYSTVQLIFWFISFILLTNAFQSNFSEYYTELMLIFIKISQVLQLFEIIFSLVGLTKGSFIASFVQVNARLVNLFLLYYKGMPSKIFLLTFIPWCTTEIIRSLYYLNKNSLILSILRYNFFIILYPTGVTGEVLALENYTVLYPDSKFYIRPIQILFVSGFFFLFYYMFKQRSKFYRKLAEDEKKEIKTK